MIVKCDKLVFFQLFQSVLKQKYYGLGTGCKTFFLFEFIDSLQQFLWVSHIDYLAHCILFNSLLCIKIIHDILMTRLYIKIIHNMGVESNDKSVRPGLA